jgi:Phage P22-like portal protein
MAKRPPKEEVSPEKAKRTAAHKAILTEVRERYPKCVEADKKNRDGFRENMRFTLKKGEQWDQQTKKERGTDRVMYETNVVRIKCKAIVNQIRSNRPSAKITPAEDGDIELAEAMKGQIDQIWNMSDGDSVIDFATETQVIGGMGAARLITRYCEDSVDEQEVVLEQVKDPLRLYADYACQKQDKSDARFWFYASKLAKEVFEAKYKDAETIEFEVDDDFNDESDDDGVWVCEYWRKEPITRTLLRLSDGKTVDADTIQMLPEGVTVLRSRQVPGHKIVQYICSGDKVLEGPNEWAGKHFPWFLVYGEYAIIDGKEVWYGAPEHAKDMQRAHNFTTTAVIETIGSTPLASTWVTATQAKDQVAGWADATRKNLPVKIYNHDPNSPGPPQREPGAQVPAALINAMQMSADGVKDAMGMPDSTLGEKGGENSGVAIRRRQEAGAVANYNFGDNVTKFVRQIYAALIDLIPKVQDTERTIRVLGKDGAEKWVKINTFDPVTGQKINDLSAVRFDLVVTQGPNFATQRQEAAETYMGLSQSNPLLQQLAGDIIFKNLDLPGAQEIGERLKFGLPPNIQQAINQGAQQDPSVIAAMQQVEQLQAQVQEQAQMVEQAAAEAQTEKAQADQAAAQAKLEQANIKTMRAELDKEIAEFKTLVAETQTKLSNDAEAQSIANDREGLSSQLTAALAQIEARGAEVMVGLAEQLANIVQSSQQPQVVVANPPKPRIIRMDKVNGSFVPVYEDQAVMQ